MTPLEDVLALIEKHKNASKFELQTLRLAAGLLEIVEECQNRKMPASFTRFTMDEYETLPDRFELDEGRVRPKYWLLYEEFGDHMSD